MIATRSTWAVVLRPLEDEAVEATLFVLPLPATEARARVLEQRLNDRAAAAEAAEGIAPSLTWAATDIDGWTWAVWQAPSGVAYRFPGTDMPVMVRTA